MNSDYELEQRARKEAEDALYAQIYDLKQKLAGEYDRGLSDGVLKGMHWLPMTEDAVFEDGKEYLLNNYVDVLFIGEYSESSHRFHIEGDGFIEPSRFTDYARITGPE